MPSLQARLVFYVLIFIRVMLNRNIPTRKGPRTFISVLERVNEEVTRLMRSAVELLAQQFVDLLGIGLALGCLHYLPDEVTK
jgi:hypothetical protein